MIIGITGRIGAGKETLTKFLREKGFIYLETSQILKEELAKRGKEITRWEMQNLGDELRKKYGPGALMKMMLGVTERNKNYLFDSIRNTGEVDFLRKEVKDFFLIAVDAPQNLRFERIINRGKASDPKTWEEFLIVDNRDFFDSKNPLGQQVGKCMEIADFKIMNDKDIEKSMKEIEKIWCKIKVRVSDDFSGVIIEESLDDKSVLKDLKIISTKTETVTEKHKTPWIKQWKLHAVEIPENEAQKIAEKISKALDKEHNWYADYKNKEFHYIIFRDKVFKIDIFSKEEYDNASEYGISLGIPSYQVDFHPEVKKWER